jgi:hypothetical protein
MFVDDTIANAEAGSLTPLDSLPLRPDSELPRVYRTVSFTPMRHCDDETNCDMEDSSCDVVEQTDEDLLTLLDEAIEETEERNRRERAAFATLVEPNLGVELQIMGLSSDIQTNLDEWVHLDNDTRYARLKKRRDDEEMHRMGFFESFDAQAPL